MKIQYDHSKNLHTLKGPNLAIPHLFSGLQIKSVLDVGCGTGSWMKAVYQHGVRDIFGIDGITPQESHFPPETSVFRQDLTSRWKLERGFDAALCLEVAEHLNEEFATTLIDCLTLHSPIIFFSAAVPGQPGQHHVNCQWPHYWQNLFNIRGYACSDSIRWKIWNLTEIEPWYRQNLFIANKNPSIAGTEPRISSVLHPDFLPYLESDFAAKGYTTNLKQIENGSMPFQWYSKIPLLALLNKIKRHL